MRITGFRELSHKDFVRCLEAGDGAWPCVEAVGDPAGVALVVDGGEIDPVWQIWPAAARMTLIASSLAPLRWLRSMRPSLLGVDQSLIVPVQVSVGGRAGRVGVEIAGSFHPRSQKA